MLTRIIKKKFLSYITLSLLFTCGALISFTTGCGDTAVKEPGGKVYRINAAACPGCGKCINSCPVNAISEIELDEKWVVIIDQEKCIGCGECVLFCPIEFDAIEKVINK